MENCCSYFILQIKNKNQWVDTEIKSKNLNEVNSKLANYLAVNGWRETRILQRSIREDRNKGRAVPRCC